MKFIPDALARKLAQQSFKVAQNSPQLLLGAGVVGMVGSTVLACRATLKMEEVLDEIDNNREKTHAVKHRVDTSDTELLDASGNVLTYTDAEYKKDLGVIKIQGLTHIAKLYLPSVLLGAASIACLTKSHSILVERNLAVTAAYAAVDQAFTRYRGRVVERYGEEVDRDLRYDSEAVDVIDGETGKVVSTTRVTAAPGSVYARFYADWSSRNWSPDPDINLMFLRTQQNWANDRLRVRGHVFLNEVYEMLGLDHTKQGAVVGWRWNKGSGDDYIDFGIWDGTKEVVNDFFHGHEGEILLDFNVDGVIYDKIGEGEFVGEER